MTTDPNDVTSKTFIWPKRWNGGEAATMRLQSGGTHTLYTAFGAVIFTAEDAPTIKAHLQSALQQLEGIE